ncbi:MAG: hypothetical protein IJU72_08390 [Bacteroidales bacterium]|nr:hypothetical protein [Bacteroidales bacterium]
MWNKPHISPMAVLLGVVLLLSTACGGDGIPTCERCYFVEPTEHTVTLLFSLSDENPTVDFTVYEGDLDGGVPIHYGVAEQSRVELVLALGRRYTVVADYCGGGRSVKVLGANKPRASFVQEACDEPCYMVSGLRFDLRLRY